MITYDTNVFSLLIDNTSFCFGELSRLSLMIGPTFPLVQQNDKDLLLKLMISRSLIDKSEFDTGLCISIINILYGELFLSDNDTKIRKLLTAIVNELNSLSTESVIVKAALLHYYLVSSKIFTDNTYQIADVLSVIYLYKSRRIPLPYFYFDSSSFRNGENVLFSDVNSYILLFLSLLNESANKYLDYYEKVNKLKEDVLVNVSELINRPQSNNIVDFIFSSPIFTADEMSKALGVTRGQVIRHLHALEESGIITGDEKQRKRTFYFERLLNICFEKTGGKNDI